MDVYPTLNILILNIFINKDHYFIFNLLILNQMIRTKRHVKIIQPNSETKKIIFSGNKMLRCIFTVFGLCSQLVFASEFGIYGKSIEI